METKFQTSFIPKRPLTNDQQTHVHKKSSFFMFISMLIFIASVASAIFVVLFGIFLTKQQADYKTQLSNNEKSFKLNLINDLRNANKKIELGKTILNKHIAVSEMFDMLNNLTSEGIKFTSLEFTADSKDPNANTNTKAGDEIKLMMHGTAKNFSSLAFQSSVWGESDKYGINKVLKSPVISELTLAQNGDVNFVLNTSMNTSDILYTKLLNK